MRKMIAAVAFSLLVPAVAAAQPVGEPSGALSRDRATLVPFDWMPETARATLEREGAGRPTVVRRIHIGNQDIYEGDFGDERVRVSEDGTIVGRDRRAR